jgi:hypothetical protein
MASGSMGRPPVYTAREFISERRAMERRATSSRRAEDHEQGFSGGAQADEISPVTLAFMSIVEAFRLKDADITVGLTNVYRAALEQIPPALLDLTIRRVILTRRFFPKPVEILEDAEATRLELKASLKFVPCANCEDSPSWCAVVVDGVPRVARCQCWHVHQQKVALLGVGEKPIALPAGGENGDE